MKRVVIIFGILLCSVCPLRADPQLIRHEKNLEKMEASRRDDREQARQAKIEIRKGTEELADHSEQQRQDVQELKSVETQEKAGKVQDALAHKSFKETQEKFGSKDARSVAAKENWKESRQATDLLGENRRTLKEDIHNGNRLVHNEKTVISVQQRAMDSSASYRASDDRKIVKEEKNIADDRKAIAENERLSQTPNLK